MSDSKPDSPPELPTDSTVDPAANLTANPTTDPKHAYELACPEGHANVEERSAKDWHTALADRNLLVYCADCERHWQPSPELTTRLMEWARTLLPG